MDIKPCKHIYLDFLEVIMDEISSEPNLTYILTPKIRSKYLYPIIIQEVFGSNIINNIYDEIKSYETKKAFKYWKIEKQFRS